MLIASAKQLWRKYDSIFNKLFGNWTSLGKKKKKKKNLN